MPTIMDVWSMAVLVRLISCHCTRSTFHSYTCTALSSSAEIDLHVYVWMVSSMLATRDVDRYMYTASSAYMHMYGMASYMYLLTAPEASP